MKEYNQRGSVSRTIRLGYPREKGSMWLQIHDGLSEQPGVRCNGNATADGAWFEYIFSKTFAAPGRFSEDNMGLQSLTGYGLTPLGAYHSLERLVNKLPFSEKERELLKARIDGGRQEYRDHWENLFRYRQTMDDEKSRLKSVNSE